MSDPGELHRAPDTFGKGPIALLTDKSISDGAVRQYLYMHWRYGKNNQNYEGRESIAEAMGVSERTVTNRTRELESAGWLVAIRQYDKKTRTTRNFYHVFEVRDECVEWRASHAIEAPEPARVRKLRQGKGGKPDHKQNDVLNLTGATDRNSSSNSDRNSSSGPDVNSGSGYDLNSGSAYLDSIDPDKTSAAAATRAREVDANEVAPLPARSNVFMVYENNVEAISQIVGEKLKALEQEYSEAWVLDAITEAVECNGRSIRYIEAILKRWKAEGRSSRKENKPHESPDSSRRSPLDGGRIGNTERRASNPGSWLPEQVRRQLAEQAAGNHGTGKSILGTHPEHDGHGNDNPGTGG